MLNEDQMLSWPLFTIVAVISLISFCLPLALGWNSGQIHPKMFFVLIGPVVIVLLMLSLRLKISVDDSSLTVRLQPFTGAQISYADIRKVEEVEYSPMTDFGGWGIRYGLGGKIYSIKGDKALKLSLASGEIIYLGTQKPNELSGAIKARMPAIIDPSTLQ